MRTGFIGFAAAAVVSVVVMAGCESKITSENYDKVNNGMTLSQVEGILGSGTDDTAPAGYGVSSGGVLEAKAAPEKTYAWREGNASIIVIFKDGKVVQKQKVGL